MCATFCLWFTLNLPTNSENKIPLVKLKPLKKKKESIHEYYKHIIMKLLDFFLWKLYIEQMHVYLTLKAPDIYEHVYLIYIQTYKQSLTSRTGLFFFIHGSWARTPLIWPFNIWICPQQTSRSNKCWDILPHRDMVTKLWENINEGPII